MEAIENFLSKRKEQGLLRYLRPVSFRKNSRVIIDNKEYFDFSSNDYLGLSGHPEIIESAKIALDAFGSGSGASRLMSGSFSLHHKLEEATADFKQKESALVFNSGYQANIGIISALFGKGDCVFSDRLNHASIIDGIILSGARMFRFRHNDIGHLKELLRKERKIFKNSLIITESVFSMEGDTAPLKEIVALKERYDCQIMLDEAHATGIYGENGSGLAEEDGVLDKVDLIMGTFSKALGGFGAYLASSKKITDYLINACRSFIYSTALPPAVIASNLKAIELVKKEPWRRKELLEKAWFFRSALKEKGLDVRGSSQIVPLVIGKTQRTLEAARFLQEKGFYLLAVRYPTVPEKEARLRFSLSLYHDKETLERLINAILQVGI
ncbi:MAG: 8-amino-7-oxononanoate synthase [Candidatus Omnitrophica bacterium]|nr:8-amino-7-oxononanoate synthase [Candidatus Omnitrophota bacterium]